jgi:hypothetical protein
LFDSEGAKLAPQGRNIADKIIVFIWVSGCYAKHANKRGDFKYAI